MFSPSHALLVEPMRGARSLATPYGRAVLDSHKLGGGEWTTFEAGDRRSGHAFLSRPLGVAYAFLPLESAFDAEAALRHAADALFGDPGIHLVKLYFGGAEPHGGVRRIAAGRCVTAVRHETVRERLHLGSSFEGFLARLGTHTRRDLRKAIRVAERNGMTHRMMAAEAVPAEPLAMIRGFSHPAALSEAQLAAVRRVIAAQGEGFCSLLCLASGEPVSLCLGFVRDHTAFLLLQINHARHLEWHPSLSGRAFLTRCLIEAGAVELVFVRGCRGILVHACETESVAEAWVLRASWSGLRSGTKLLLHSRPGEIPAKLQGLTNRVLSPTA